MSRLLIAAFALLLTGCAATAPRSPGATAPATETWSEAEQPTNRGLQERWWTWAASSPEERNPVVDTTGRFCGEDQPSDVWFFAGTFGGAAERSCQVPAGRPLAGPAVNQTSGCASFLADATGSVTLDGQPVELRRIGPTVITFQAARDNVMGLPAGRVPAEACGLWAWVPPLAPGEYELRIEGLLDVGEVPAHRGVRRLVVDGLVVGGLVADRVLLREEPAQQQPEPGRRQDQQRREGRPTR